MTLYKFTSTGREYMTRMQNKELKQENERLKRENEKLSAIVDDFSSKILTLTSGIKMLHDLEKSGVSKSK